MSCIEMRCRMRHLPKAVQTSKKEKVKSQGGNHCSSITQVTRPGLTMQYISDLSGRKREN